MNRDCSARAHTTTSALARLKPREHAKCRKSPRPDPVTILFHSWPSLGDI
jgi:hypothetical protein